MRRPIVGSIAFVVARLIGPLPAHAGMPSFTLTDIAKARLDTISFCLVLLLAFAGIVQLLRMD